jgi:hypothetical protein
VRNRNQQRQRAILPVKIVSGVLSLLGHTLDISAYGARVVVLSEIAAASNVIIEFKHRRANATISWCRPVKGRKYEYELGLRMRNSGCDFWGVKLSTHDLDVDPSEAARMPFEKIMTLLSPKSL